MKATPLKQAVILAGGQGTRLRPLTDTRPKPMVEFHGRPFLAYLLENLREQGISDVLLLLGYLPDVVRDHFGDGRAFGLRLDYSVSPVEDDTGQRVRLAAPKLDDIFLLMYCDNYWPLRLDEMWSVFQARDLDGQITVYANRDGYTRDNLRVDANERVTHYDKTRRAPNLAGVDIGYAIFRKSVLRHLPAGNVPLESSVYPRLVAQGRLGAYTTEHRYYSVGSHERLPLTERFLKREPAILLDRDGVLNRKAPKARYITKWSEFAWLPGAREALALLRAAGYRILVISNQPGIARGAMTEAELADIHDAMRADAEAAGGRIDAVYYCPHGWDDGCECRKPRPGLLYRAQREWHLDLTRVFFVGDDVRDAQAGNAAGCRTILVSEDYPLPAAVREQVLESEPAGSVRVA